MLRRLRGGSTFRDACAAAGIAWKHWIRWRKTVEDEDGTTGDPDKDSLVRDARVAYHAATCDILEGVKAEAPADWKAGAWIVEYREGSAKRRSEQVRAHHEARLAKLRADAAASGGAAGTVALILPDVLATPRGGTE
jgi:hypothetical protein